MIALTEKKFDILDHIAALEPTKRKNRYICPVCGGNDLTIDPKTGKYQCWHGCECRDIREALAPWEQVKQSNNSLHNYSRKRRSFSTQKSPKSVPIPLGEKGLAILPEPPNDLPQANPNPFIPNWLIDQGVPTTATETRYWYSQTQWVSRFEWSDPDNPKGHNKTIRPAHIKPDGTTEWKKGQEEWKPYRLSEAIAHGQGKWVFGLEGEQCVEIARSLQLVSITWQGGSWTDEEIVKGLKQLQEGGVAGLVEWEDHDEAGEKKAQQILKAAAQVQFPVLRLNPLAIWEGMPHKGDIADWVAWGRTQGMSENDFLNRLEEEFRQEVERRRLEQEKAEVQDEVLDDFLSFTPSGEITQDTLDYLYGDKPWICVNDKLYYWTGTHYKHSPDVIELKRLADFLNAYPVVDKNGQIRYLHAKPSKVRQCLEWLKLRFGVDPSLVNPPGLNCTNGVLKINWIESQPSWQLVPHHPSQYYLYEPLVTYNPLANPTECERMLQCLDAPQQEIFLRTIAASLDLATVRSHKGRLVRALLLKGDGNNGKDTLREAVAAMYGYMGLTGATLEDFANYDKGRKFPLARTAGSHVNWASENANFSQLDRIQSLKAFITGDTISIERKGVDEWDFNPAAVALFNVNDVPRLDGALEAIQSRYGVLSFNKTFKIGADPNKGEIEAEPRFKYDPSFLRECVLPAFLNRVLQALVDLMRDGIDYSCTQKALEDIQSHNSHLWQFCQDVGLGYVPGAVTPAGEIWEALKGWYIDNGTLTFEETSSGKEKAIWTEQARKGDLNVKGANQVIPRFQALFPKAKRVTVGKGVAALSEIGWLPPAPGDEPSPGRSGEAIKFPGSATPIGVESLKPLAGKDGEAVAPNGEPVVSQWVSLEALPELDGEPVTPVSEKTGKKIEQKNPLPQGNPQIEGQKNQDNGGEVTRQAHHPDKARVSASPAPPDGLTPSPELAHPPAPARVSADLSVGDAPTANHSLDYSTFPHLTSNDIKAKENRARAIREAMCYCITKGEFVALRHQRGFSPSELDWVYQHLDKQQKAAVDDALRREQLNLLERPTPPESIEFSDIIAATNREMQRIGWTPEQGKQYLISTYGKRSRQLLSDGELLEFWDYLKGKPSV